MNQRTVLKFAEQCRKSRKVHLLRARELPRGSIMRHTHLVLAAMNKQYEKTWLKTTEEQL